CAWIQTRGRGRRLIDYILSKENVSHLPRGRLGHNIRVDHPMPALISAFRIAAGVALVGILVPGTLVLAANSRAIGSSVQATVGSTPAPIETDGTLDLSFNPGNFTNGNVAASVLQPDGKLLIGG